MALPPQATLTPPSPLHLLLLSLSLKLLLFPTRASTDMEVHRHWKALVHSTPPSMWYRDETSIWTLDYPPLFAYFEYFLSHLARIFTPQMLTLRADTYHPTQSDHNFLRATVLLSEPLLLYATFRLATTLLNFTSPPKTPTLKRSIAIALVLLSPGLTLIDNIHFQYNALPLSFFLLTLSHIHPSHPSPQIPTFLFVLTLHLKQTLLPLTPPIALHLLSTTLKSSPSLKHLLATLTALILTSLLTLTLLWAPFYTTPPLQTLKHILNRLFPFSRGLLHAYWPPNLWALYASLDKLLTFLNFPTRPVDIDPASGHIGARNPFAVLPNPIPATCTAILLALLIPVLIVLVKRPTKFLPAIVYTALASFLVGWHVHEKAILIPLLPLAVFAAVSDDPRVVHAFLWLSLAGQFALFPLLQGGQESVFKVAHFVAYHAFAFAALLRPGKWRWSGRFLVPYAVGCVVLELYSGIGGGHRAFFGDRLPFLPLMLVSIYGAGGVCVAFSLLTVIVVLDPDSET